VLGVRYDDARLVVLGLEEGDEAAWAMDAGRPKGRYLGLAWG
jgi:hypothetical protein